MTGLAPDQLAVLVDRVAAVVRWDADTGRPRELPLATAVVAVLFGLRHNLGEQVVGELFEVSQPTVCRYRQLLEPVINAVVTPEAAARVTRAHRDAVLVDGFVAPVGERDGVDGLFSGKKHVSGQNVQVVADLDGRVADVGDPVPGATHDARAFTDSGIAARWRAHYQPGGAGMVGDKGYQGTGIITPVRKPPRGELSTSDKTYNTSVNRIRAAAERAIAHLKNWKILKTGYRRQLTDFPTLLQTVTKLEIFRVWGPSFE